MPYYVYQISPGISSLVKPMKQLQEFSSYKQARDYARDQRSKQPSESKDLFKVIFAENTLEAEEKLNEFREAPILTEWEK